MEELRDAETSRTDFEAIDSFGIGETLQQAQAELAASAAILAEHASSGRACSHEPFVCNSHKRSIQTYAAALDRVESRFWTTSFLSSGFWSEVDETVIGANRRLTRRLAQIGSVSRRLFLLPFPVEKEIQQWQVERMLLCKAGDAEALARSDAKFETLRSNIETLLANGCAARVIYDSKKHFSSLPAALGFDYDDSELGIYDDWRVDVFRGGRSGVVKCVESFTPVMKGFEDLRDQTVACFEQLWQQASPVSDLLERIGRAIEHSARRIDYQSTWLARYDHGLPAEDQTLKVAELSTVKMELQRLGKWGRVRRHLDVGTCTGRYPLSLRDAVDPAGEILGIDNDIDCVNYSRRNIEREVRDDARFRIERVDFCAEDNSLDKPFDLITCMLGTLVHFGRECQTPPYGDPLQRSLEKFVALLDEDGVLFFSVWSEASCQALSMLSIYTEEDKRHLARACPTAAELRGRLAAAGLQFEDPYQIEGRMDLYRCTAPKSAAGRRAASTVASRSH